MAATTLAPVPMSLRDGDGAAACGGRRRASSERVYGRTVSANFFDVLGVRPALGRFFRGDEDEVADARPVIVLSHRFWRERFRSDPACSIARSAERHRVHRDRRRRSGFENTTFVGTDLWMPMAMARPCEPPPNPRRTARRSAIDVAHGDRTPEARRDGEAAQAELNTLFDAFKAGTPAVPASHGILVVRSGRVPPPVRLPFSAFVGCCSC